MDMKYILEIFDIFEAYCLCRFILFHCPYKDGKRHPLRTILFGLSYIMIVATSNIAAYGKPIPAGLFLSVINSIIFAHFNLKHSLRYKILICTVVPVIFLLLDSAVASMYMLLSTQENPWQAMFEPGRRIVFALIAKLADMIFMEIYYIIYKGKSEKNTIGMNVVIFSILGTGMSFILSSFMLKQTSSSYVFIVLLYGIIMLIIYYGLFYMMDCIKRDNEEQIKYQMVIEEHELIRQHYAESKDIYIQLKIKRHDYKHHIAYMEYLYDEEKYVKLKEYILRLRMEEEKNCEDDYIWK